MTELPRHLKRAADHARKVEAQAPRSRQGQAHLSRVPMPAFTAAASRTYTCPTCGFLPKKTIQLPTGGSLEVPVACQHLIDQEKKAAAAAKQAENAKAAVKERETFDHVLPPRDWARTLPSNPKLLDKTDAKALAKARAYVDNFASNLDGGIGGLWHGTPGTAKSYWSKWVAQQVAAQGHFVIWVNIQLLTTMLTDWDTKADLVRALIAVDLLVLDELVSIGENRWTVEDLFSVVFAREDAGRPTLITTNFDDLVIANHYRAVLMRGKDAHPAAKAQTLIERFMSRLQPPAFRRVDWAGEDLRLVLAALDQEDADDGIP